MVTGDAQPQWRIWTFAKSEMAAKRVYKRVAEALGCDLLGFQLVRDSDGGEYMFSFKTYIKCPTRNDCIVALIEVGQTLGYEWTLFGDIGHNPSAWSNRPNIVGVKAIQWELLDRIVQDAV